MNKNWWELQKNIHESVVPYIDNLDTKQSYKHTENIKHMMLYGNYGFPSQSYTQMEESSVQHRVTLNIIQSMIDTVVSKITKSKPKPTFLTDGADWSLQQKAKKLTKFCEGMFYSSKLYAEAISAFVDSCIFGTGAVKFYKEDGTIKTERVIIDEIKVDDGESIYGCPRQIHQVKYIHKDILKARFPKFQAELEIETDSQNFRSSTVENKDMIRVVESWRLPSSPDSEDGLHSICVRSATLFIEEYKKTYFPFAFMRWTKRPIGFFGQGLSEQLTGIQLEINKILRTIQISMHLTCIPKVFMEASSKVVTSHINSKIGGIIRYVGTKPSYESVGAIAPELFSHLDRLYNRAYEIAGVSQLSARSLKPAGLDSGKALREFNDLESERFLDVSKRYEEFFMESANIMLDMARDMYSKDEEDLKVKVKGSRFIETIKWSEVDMEEDKYMMQVFPTSALSSTPSARMQDVQELLQAGFISKEEGMKLLDFPDLEANNSLITADIENIDRQIELMVHEKSYETPEPYQNLELCLRRAQQAYLKYKHNNAPEESLELLRRYMDDAQDLIMKAQPEAPMAPPMEPTPSQDIAAMADQINQPTTDPMAVPAPAPVSDILPIG